MRILIADDDYASRKFLLKLLSQFGECDVTVDGIETVEAFAISYDLRKPYNLICLDIMMPKIDGLKALKTIRDFEKKKGIAETQKCKVIITSALSESEVIFDSFCTDNEVYATKPFGSEQIIDAMRKLRLI